MALTKVGPAGIGSTPGTGYVIGNSFLHATGLDATNAKFTGIVTAQTFRVLGNFQVDGTTTTLDTEVTSVDKLEVAANNTTVGVAITQSGSGDILNLYDGSTEVFSVADGGNVSATGVVAIDSADGYALEVKNGNTQLVGLYKEDATGGYIYVRNSSGTSTISLSGNTGSINASGDLSIADKIIHTGDTNTAIRFPAADTITAETDGSERVRITSGGNVNIGGNYAETSHQLNVSSATNPSFALHTGTTLRADFSATSGITSIRSYSNSPFTVNIGGSGETEAFRIDGSARILVGTTADITGSSDTSIQVVHSGGGRLALGRNHPAVTDGNDLGFIGFYSNDDSGYQEAAYIKAEADGTFAQDDKPGRIVFGTTADGGSSGTERLRIDSNGLIANNGRAPSSYGSSNLLISGDNATLTIMGDGSTNNSSIAAIKFRVAGASTGDYTKAAIFAKRMGGYNDLDMIFAMDTAADANGVNLGNEKMRLTSAGLVGIGTNSPTGKLEVAHDSQTDLLKLKRTSGNTGTFTISLGGANPGTIFSTSGVCDDFVFIAGSERLRITSAGKVGIGENAPDNLLHLKSTDTPAIELEQDDGTSYKGLIKLAGNDLEIRGSSGLMEFYNGSQDGDSSALRMSITNAGRVLIGDSAATSLLSVGGANYNWDQGDIPMVLIKGYNNETPTSGTNNVAIQIEDENNNLIHKVWNTGGGNTDLGNVLYTGRFKLGDNTFSPLNQLHICDKTTSSWDGSLNKSRAVLRLETHWNALGERAINDYGGGIVWNHLGGHSGQHHDNAHAFIGLRVHDTPGHERSKLIFATNDVYTNPAHDAGLVEAMHIKPNGSIHMAAGTNDTGSLPGNVVNEKLTIMTSTSAYPGSHVLFAGQYNGNWEEGTGGFDSCFGLGWVYQGSSGADQKLRAGIAYDHKGTEEFKYWSSYGAHTWYVDKAKSGTETAETCDTKVMQMNHMGSVINYARPDYGIYTLTNVQTINGGGAGKNVQYLEDCYGQWIVVAKIQQIGHLKSPMASVVQIDTSLDQATGTEWSSSFGDNYPIAVRYVSSSNWSQWRDYRGVDFIQGVPHGRRWKNFFTNGASSGMTQATGGVGSAKYGWTCDGAWDGKGRWHNPAFNWFRMSDTSGYQSQYVTDTFFTTATAANASTALYLDYANDAKFGVHHFAATGGQDSPVTSVYGYDDNLLGHEDNFPNQPSNNGGADITAMPLWICINVGSIGQFN